MAIRLGFTAADLVRVRFAVSPLWETNAAVRLLAHPRADSPRRAWLHSVGETVEVAPGSDLAGLIRLMPASGYTPDFLAPAPSGPGTTFEQERAGVLRTPAPQVRAEIRASLDGAPLDRSLAWLLDDPGVVLHRLTSAQTDVWDRLVRPTWADMLDVLEADIAHQSRRSARGGAQALFAGLDDRVSWDDADSSLTVRLRVEEQRDLGGQGLVLMPSSFVWPDVAVVTQPPWQPTLIYPARGVGALWARAERAGDDVLDRLLGGRRAAVLRTVATPSTTSRLARQLAASPAGISEHLGVLRAAGLVVGHRTGRVVQYSRTDLGDRLVDG